MTSTRKFAPPDPRIVFSMANQPLKWWKALAEWIDNALDAGAQTISIQFARDSVRVHDDGRGCDDPVVMILPGRHHAQPGTVQGVFGVGGKDAALWIGGIKSATSIATTHNGVRRSICVHWSDYVQDSSYEESGEQLGGASGTEITVTPLSRKLPHGEDWTKLLEQLGYIYTPPLGRGVQIKMQRPGKPWEPLVAWKAPPLQGEIIDTDITVGDKLKAHVFCGIVQDGVLNPRSGFTYFHGSRVVESASANGCGGYSPHRIHGRVDLFGQWPRTKNKDALNADAPTIAALYEEVARVCGPLLQRADTIGSELSSMRFVAEVNDRLNSQIAALKNRKAKREKRQNHVGTITPTNTGRTHKRARREQTGSTFGSRRGGSMRVVFDTLEGSVAGRVQVPTITLNLGNPRVRAIKEESNAEATVTLALSLLTWEHCIAPQEQPFLTGLPQNATPEDFSAIFGNLLAGDLSIDGRAVAAPKTEAVA